MQTYSECGNCLTYMLFCFSCQILVLELKLINNIHWNNIEYNYLLDPKTLPLLLKSTNYYTLVIYRFNKMSRSLIFTCFSCNFTTTLLGVIYLYNHHKAHNMNPHLDVLICKRQKVHFYSSGNAINIFKNAYIMYLLLTFWYFYNFFQPFDVSTFINN